MFVLEKLSPYFDRFSSEHSEIVNNIEILFENKLQLDLNYHYPKQFILSLNNVLRSLVYFVEKASKNTSKWEKDSVYSYVNSHLDEYEIVKYLRNRSAHQRLVIPAESLIAGLFRIKSDTVYILKIGVGEKVKPTAYSPEFTLKNTEDVFDDLLVFHSLAFMDLNHSSIGECLGITRRWLYEVKFKNKTKEFDRIIDVYWLVTTFISGLIDSVCLAYAEKSKIDYVNTIFDSKLSEYNFVNTILEIDLYPAMFDEWWGGKNEPLNYGVLVRKQDGERIVSIDGWYKKVYGMLCNANEYLMTLRLFSGYSLNDYNDKLNIEKFCSFIYHNHLHYKKAYSGNFISSPLNPADIYLLQKSGKRLIEELQKGKNCKITNAYEIFSLTLRNTIKKLEEKSA